MPATRTSLHRSIPRIKATVLSAVGCIVFIAETVRRLVVQVFSHPRLGADSDRLVGLTVAGVSQRPSGTATRHNNPLAVAILDLRYVVGTGGD